jgi:hypothetical protein
LTAGQACSSPYANNDAEASVKVNEILRLDATELGDRLKRLKKSGHVDITTSEYPSSLTLPNSISKVYLTELGRRSLKQKR